MISSSTRMEALAAVITAARCTSDRNRPPTSARPTTDDGWGREGCTRRRRGSQTASPQHDSLINYV